MRRDVCVGCLKGNGAKRITMIGTQELKPFSPGKAVSVRRPGEKVLPSATCMGFAGPHTFLVKTDVAVNRRDLLSTGKTPVTDQPDLPDLVQSP